MIARGREGEATEAEAKDERVETAIGDEEVGAPAEEEGAEAAIVGPGEGLDQRRLVLDLGEEAGRAADAEGGPGGERDLLARSEAGPGAHFTRIRVLAMKPSSTACTFSTKPV